MKFTSAFALVFVLAMAGCRPAQTPRYAAHGAVLAVAQAVRISADMCEESATSMFEAGQKQPAFALIERCEHGFNVAVPAIRAAAFAVDDWGKPEANSKTACSVSEAVVGLHELAAAVAETGAKMPREIDDAYAAADWLIKTVGGTECKLH